MDARLGRLSWYEGLEVCVCVCICVVSIVDLVFFLPPFRLFFRAAMNKADENGEDHDLECASLIDDHGAFKDLGLWCCREASWTPRPIKDSEGWLSASSLLPAATYLHSLVQIEVHARSMAMPMDARIEHSAR
ncbi:hypothetical protein ACJQWK_11158 [Exserohilum turcicum]